MAERDPEQPDPDAWLIVEEARDAMARVHAVVMAAERALEGLPTPATLEQAWRVRMLDALVRTAADVATEGLRELDRAEKPTQTDAP